tara:strand:+ start:17 stop:223 length:207 start_codon:yes stop_codon:yes gene_type:complete
MGERLEPEAWREERPRSVRKKVAMSSFSEFLVMEAEPQSVHWSACLAFDLSSFSKVKRFVAGLALKIG